MQALVDQGVGSVVAIAAWRKQEYLTVGVALGVPGRGKQRLRMRWGGSGIRPDP